MSTPTPNIEAAFAAGLRGEPFPSTLPRTQVHSAWAVGRDLAEDGWTAAEASLVDVCGLDLILDLPAGRFRYVVHALPTALDPLDYHCDRVAWADNANAAAAFARGL